MISELRIRRITGESRKDLTFRSCKISIVTGQHSQEISRLTHLYEIRTRFTGKNLFHQIMVKTYGRLFGEKRGFVDYRWLLYSVSINWVTLHLVSCQAIMADAILGRVKVHVAGAIFRLFGCHGNVISMGLEKFALAADRLKCFKNIRYEFWKLKYSLNSILVLWEYMSCLWNLNAFGKSQQITASKQQACLILTRCDVIL